MRKVYKKIFAFIITVTAVVSCTAALAASPEPTTRPRPASGQTAVQSEDKSDTKSSNTKKDNDADTDTKSDDKADNKADNKADDKESSGGISITVEATPAPQTAAAVSDKHYTTRGGAFGWFILSVIINALLSFAIGSRFYKMTKKNNHVSAEVRALRRDIEEKFNSNIGGFAEHDAEITNSNESYAMDENGIKPNIKKTEEEISAEETFRQWETNLAKQEAEKREALREALKPRSTREFVEKDSGTFDNHRGEKAYRPEREPEDIPDEEYEEESTFEAIKHKAKEIITDIFPFRED